MTTNPRTQLATAIGLVLLATALACAALFFVFTP